MVNLGQIRGMLLEEAVLHLLGRSGYRTVNTSDDDPTLSKVGAGLAVRGRGGVHQIDALADFVVHHPFSNPQRLMVEAKCFDSNKRVGIDVIRNAIGVLKDTSEFWISGPNSSVARSRYHYQYAVFSASEFTTEAQRYAFAHDVYLLPLARSRFFRPILDAIRQVSPPAGAPKRAPNAVKPGQFAEARSQVRKVLAGKVADPDQLRWFTENSLAATPFVEACKQLDFALVAVLGGRFPVLLSPSDTVKRRKLGEQTMVRIFWNDRGWYLMDHENELLFSFDIPEDLFRLYADGGFIAPGPALDLKQQIMSTFQAVEVVDGLPRLLSFELDSDWIKEIRSQLNRNE